MQPNQQPYDPGLTRQYTGAVRRVVNKDGSFNVRRPGTAWRWNDLYLSLVSASWPVFFALSFAGYIVVNCLFALAFLFLAGPDQIEGARAPTTPETWARIFFFSVHTFTTVGYGNMVPKSIAANVLAAVGAMSGLLWFAVNTGLLFVRFSRPSARLVFSRQAVVAPYAGGQAVMFRVANGRRNILMDLEAKVLLMTVEESQGRLERRYTPLTLERPAVQFLPLTWTVVHPIAEGSPLAGRTAADMEALQAELLILIRAFDDSFSQTVHSRHSYRYDEFAWGYRFLPAFSVDSEGELILALERMDHIAEAGA
jgi:inward rectifier potassium channel